MRALLEISHVTIIIDGGGEVSRQAKELVMMKLIILLMVLLIVLIKAVEVNVSISFSFVKIRIFTLILASKFGF